MKKVWIPEKTNIENSPSENTKKLFSFKNILKRYAKKSVYQLSLANWTLIIYFSTVLYEAVYLAAAI